MAVPSDPVARRYYRAAVQRLEDARAVLGIGRSTAAVYLAGYCVECLLKALVVTATPAAQRSALLPDLLTHDFVALRQRYAGLSGGPLPTAVRNDLNVVQTWAPRLRYDPGTIPADTARRFVAAAGRIADWAGERL